MNANERYTRVLDYLSALLPEAKSELNYESDFQLLVAVVLSAQCTDKRVNIITKELFAHYPTAFEMARATEEDIYTLISSCSYPHSKAAHIAAMSKKLVTDFNGVVPDNMEQLTTLPGVGRKTANVMLAVAFDKPAMPVDTHVFRVAHRLGLVNKNAKTPEETERQLTRHIPTEKLSKAHHWFLLFGRYTCTARNPKCDGCGLSDICTEKMKPLLQKSVEQA